jgi:hypothetical protein
MFSLVEMKEFLDSLNNQSVETLGMTHSSPEETTSFILSGGSSLGKNLKSIDLTLTNRSAHPGKSEENCFQWYEDLNNKTNFYIGNTNITLVRSSDVPQYLGKRSNGLFYFTINFTILAEVQ